jgi:hypothetical protein
MHGKGTEEVQKKAKKRYRRGIEEVQKRYMLGIRFVLNGIEHRGEGSASEECE